MPQIGAGRFDPRGGVEIERPVGELKTMAAEIGDRPAAEVIPAPPVSRMVDAGLIGAGRRRAEPEIPVESCGNRIAARGAIDAVWPAMGRMPDMHLRNRPEQA